MRSHLARIAVPALVVLVAANAARAQSLNVKCAPAAAIPPTYGAGAAQPGHWNGVSMPSAGTPLLDLAGVATGVVATVTNQCDSYVCGDCFPQGCTGLAGSPEDLALFGSWMNGDCLGQDVLTLIGLQPGRYALHVYLYGCPNPGPATVQVELGAESQSLSPPPVVFQGNWGSFAYARVPLQVSASTALELHFWGSGTAGLAGFQLVLLEPTGTILCLGDGTGAPCPCGNVGLPGHGCRNSATIRGAELGAVGDASLSFDTLGIACAFEPPFAASVVLQGDQLVAPTPFGDGLRCAGGNLKRLVVANASSSGTLAAPANATASISARSAALGDPLQAGDTRVYQVYYRDPSETFCPPPQGSTFNASNAVEIVWGT